MLNCVLDFWTLSFIRGNRGNSIHDIISDQGKPISYLRSEGIVISLCSSVQQFKAVVENVGGS